VSRWQACICNCAHDVHYVHIICSRPATVSTQKGQQGVRDTTKAWHFWMPASIAALAQQPLACTDKVETLGLQRQQFPNRAAQGCGKAYLPGLSQRSHIVMGTADCAVSSSTSQGLYGSHIALLRAGRQSTLCQHCGSVWRELPPLRCSRCNYQSRARSGCAFQQICEQQIPRCPACLLYSCAHWPLMSSILVYLQSNAAKQPQPVANAQSCRDSQLATDCVGSIVHSHFVKYTAAHTPSTSASCAVSRRLMACSQSALLGNSFINAHCYTHA
jgi:hypothetical protein